MKLTEFLSNIEISPILRMEIIKAIAQHYYGCQECPLQEVCLKSSTDCTCTLHNNIDMIGG